jgi:hypothetical protein
MFDIPYESVLGMLVMWTSYIWAMPLYLPRELGVIVPLLDEAIGRKLSLRLASFTGCVFLDVLLFCSLSFWSRRTKNDPDLQENVRMQERPKTDNASNSGRSE